MSGAATIRVSYLEDEAHFVEAAEKAPGYRSGRYRLQLLFGGIMVVMTGLLLLEPRKGDRLWWLPIGIAPAIFGVIWVSSLSEWGMRRSLKQSLKKQLKQPPVTAWLEFGDGGFLVTGGGGVSSHHPWPTIPRVAVRADGLHLFISDTIYLWVPDRLFASRTEFDSLVTLLRSNVPRVDLPSEVQSR
jgi:hypothetical protein